MPELLLPRPFRSFKVKLAFLLTVLLLVPVMVFGELRGADAEKRHLLLRTVQEQGRLIARGLETSFRNLDAKALPELNAALARFGGGDMRIKVFFRPAPELDAFYHVAAWPASPDGYLESERRQLVDTGVLADIGARCDGQRVLAAEYRNPAGREEVLTSLTPVASKAGCWLIITSHPAAGLLGVHRASFWGTPEMRIAASIYAALAVLVITQFVGIWRSLRRFAALAGRIAVRGGGPASFRALNRIPELDDVAAEFDRLVSGLRKSAEDMRIAADEKAHALKAPIAVISQAIEPLRRSVAAEDARGRRAVEIITASVAKLDTLISAARQSEEATAELIEAAPRPTDLAAFLHRLVNGYAMLVDRDGLTLRLPDTPAPKVLADHDLLAAAMENIIDNALSYSPPGGRVSIVLAAAGGGVEVLVGDEGPGVTEQRLEAIFQRYYTSRGGDAGDGEPHYGLGLWIVRRNVEALGGTVVAQNRTPHGLLIRIRLPRAP